MKKVVVVVDGHDRMVFTGEDLDVIDGTSYDASFKSEGRPMKLVIREKKKSIAVFKHWAYWKEVRKGTDEKSELISSIKKILVRPKTPVASALLREFLKSLSQEQIVLIPHSWDMVIIYKSGKTKIL